MLMAGQKMTSKIKKWLVFGREILGSLLFPPRCPVCDEILAPEETKKGIHLACENKLYPIYGAVCMHCGRPFDDSKSNKNKIQFESVREYCYDCIQKGYTKQSNITQGKSLYRYKGVAKSMMYRFKYSNKREYADYFARQAVEKYGVWMKHRKIDVIVPVPMYLPKQRKRGYNQAETFAKKISEITGIPIDTKRIYRVVNTTPQKGLDAQARKNNLKNAFQTGKNVVQCNCALIVDDIYTTGSTAEAVARELIKQGTHQVYLLTVCIGGDM